MSAPLETAQSLLKVEDAELQRFLASTKETNLLSETANLRAGSEGGHNSQLDQTLPRTRFEQDIQRRILLLQLPPTAHLPAGYLDAFWAPMNE